MKISEYSIKKPATIIIGIIAVIVFGILALTSMKQDLITPISMPSILVYTIYPGASPVDIEQSITNPFEERLNQIAGVDSIESQSKKSVTFIKVNCDWSADLLEMKGEVESAIHGIPLPDGAMPPQILIMDSNLLPIISFKVEAGLIEAINPDTGLVELDEKSGKPVLVRRNLSRMQITEFLEENVVNQLKKIDNVSTVQLMGGENEELTIRLDMDKVQAKKVSPINIFTILKYSNMNLPSGNVTYGDKYLNFRTEGKFKSAEDVRNMVVDFKAEERTFIRLRDVAEVEITPVKADHYAEYDSQPIILLQIQKLPSGDTVKIIEEAKAIIADTVEKSGNLLSFSPILDSSKDIRAAIDNVKDSAILGALLAIIVIFLFLQNLRTTIIVGVSIPLSVIISFCMMKLAGLDLNLMTLGGMTVAIGMIVDSSIVVLDNTYIHFTKTGDRIEAAKVGAEEVGSAVFASIATSLAVFIPILTMSGLVGAILKDVSLTIVFALTASLIVSLMVVPFLSSKLLKMPSNKPKTWLGKGFIKVSDWINRGLDKLGRGYSFALQTAIKNRTFVVIVAVFILLLSVFSLGLIGFQFLDAPDMGEFEIVVKTPSGTSMEETRDKMRMINDEVKELLGDNLQSGMFVTGVDPTFGMGGNPTNGMIRLRLIDSKKRDRGMSIFKVIPMLQEELPKRVPGVDITVNNGGLAKMLSYATGGNGFVVNISGNNFDDLSKAALEIARRVQEHPSVYKTEINVNLQEKELVSKLKLDSLGHLGITPYEAAASQLLVFQGMDAGKFILGEEEYNIRLTSDMEGIDIQADSLNRVPVQSQTGDFVTLAVLSDLVESSASDMIPHVNRVRSITVSGLISNGADIAQEMRPVLESMPIPVGVEWEIAGSSSLLGDTLNDMILVFAIAVFLVYAVMVIQFQRFVQPLIIMASIPFVFIGCTVSLLISGLNLSLVAMLAVVALAGTVVNNAIVLVDYTNLLRDKYHQSLDEALINAGRTRLRPILMTTLTTALGVVPMMLARAEGSELYKPLGWVIFGGLLTSTIITLFLVPVLYHIVEFRKEKKQNKQSVLQIEEKIEDK